MSDRVVLAHGSDIEEAIENGLRDLGVSRNEVLVEVVDEGRRGLLGLGSREAAVRLTAIAGSTSPAAPETAPLDLEEELQPAPVPEPAEGEAPDVEPVEMEPADIEPVPAAAADAEGAEKLPEYMEEEEAAVADEEIPESPVVEQKAEDAEAVEEAPAAPSEAFDARHQETAEIAEEIVRELVEKLGFEDVTVSTSFSEPDDRTGRVMTIVDVEGEELGSLIGARGETLNDLQYIARLMVGHALRRRADFVIDVNNYRQKREEALARLAERMAEKALRRGEPITMEPMSSYDRRLIHIALRSDERVYTNSVGEGSSRRVRIYLQEEE